MPVPDVNTQVTLGSWINFYNQYGKDLDAELTVLLEMAAGTEKDLQLNAFYIDRAYCLYAFYNEMPIEHAQDNAKLSVVLDEYVTRYAWVFNYDPAAWDGMEWMGFKWVLPVPEIDNTTLITFGEFIDSKTFVQGAREEKLSRWQLILFIAAIFLRPEGEPHQERNTAADAERMQMHLQLPLSAAMAVGYFFDQFNAYLEKTFAIFQPSYGRRPGKYSAQHFAVYGWINFLKSIAKTKIYDIPASGLNSIECARIASVFDVLVDASEEKSLGDAQAADAEARQ